MISKIKENLKKLMRSDQSGTGRFSFHCKNCGYTFSSNNKEEVIRAKRNHKIFITKKIKGNEKVFKVCPMVRTGHGTLTRPNLKAAAELNHIEQRQRKLARLYKGAI